MKSSEYHKTYGLSGQIRGIGTNTELHFEFPPGETRTSVEINIQGQTVEGYLELMALPMKRREDEMDLGIRLVFGPRPAEDYKPKPGAVAGNQGKVATPERMFDPGPPPELVPLPPVLRKPQEVHAVDRFVPEASPVEKPEEGKVEEKKPEVGKVEEKKPEEKKPEEKKPKSNVRR